MLQQTQVDRVIDYYHRLLYAYPTIRTLANAKVDSVLQVWKGLGYYNRAVSLHHAARIIVARHRGRFQNTIKNSMQLPGIGRYTAGALYVFGMRQEATFVDTNIARVLRGIHYSQT